MKIRFKKLRESAIKPKRATEGSAAYDVFLPEEFYVMPGRNIAPLGLAVEVPMGYEAKIEPRSGFSSKGMEDASGERHDADVIVGKIDSDYRNGIGVIISNHEGFQFLLGAGTRIAQLTIYKVEDADFEEVEELSTTSRKGGFGSTGSGITN